MTTKYPEVEVQLVGQDGNAYAILGAVTKALRRYLMDQGETAAETKAVTDAYYAEATSGDYDALLRTTMAWVEVT